MNWVVLASLVCWIVSSELTRYRTHREIASYITARMKTVSPSLSAAQALDDLRMAVESGYYEVVE